MGFAGIVMFFALAAAPPTDVHTEPPCGGRSSAIAFATREQVEQPETLEQVKQLEWLGFEAGGALVGLAQPGRPGAVISSFNFAIFGMHHSFAAVQSLGRYADRAGVSAAHSLSELSTFDTVVFTRAGFPAGTAFPARVELIAYAASARDFGKDAPRDDGRVTLRSTLASDMLPEPLSVEANDKAESNPAQPIRASRDVTLRTGVEYRVWRSQHASVSTVRVGAEQSANCGGTIQSRVTIRPLVLGVTLKSCASTGYFPCPADLDSSWFVDDADFLLFAAAYALGDCSDPSMPLGCPADLNYDGIVDAADFVLFLPGYDDGFCPLFGDIDFGPQ